MLVSVLLGEGGLHGRYATVLRFEFEVDAILYELPIVERFHNYNVRILNHTLAAIDVWVLVVTRVNNFKTL